MSMIRRILSELRTPDDQGRDWYGWATNQLAHAFLGALVAYAFPAAAIQMTLIVAVAKETVDILRKPISRVALLDSAFDVCFWAIGSAIAITGGDIVCVIIMAFALVCGIIPRMRAK